MVCQLHQALDKQERRPVLPTCLRMSDTHKKKTQSDAEHHKFGREPAETKIQKKDILWVLSSTTTLWHEIRDMIQLNIRGNTPDTCIDYIIITNSETNCQFFGLTTSGQDVWWQNIFCLSDGITYRHYGPHWIYLIKMSSNWREQQIASAQRVEK